MRKKLHIETEDCIGCETCVELCPGVFAFDENLEKAYVKTTKKEPDECVDEAIESCPTGCIHWEDF